MDSEDEDSEAGDDGCELDDDCCDWAEDGVVGAAKATAKAAAARASKSRSASVVGGVAGGVADAARALAGKRSVQHRFSMLKVMATKEARLLLDGKGRRAAYGAVVPAGGTRLLLFAFRKKDLRAWRHAFAAGMLPDVAATAAQAAAAAAAAKAENDFDGDGLARRGALTVEVRLSGGVGLSVVDDVGGGSGGMRREVLYGALTGISLKQTTVAATGEAELALTVERAQLDNQLPGAASPVAIAGRPEAKKPAGAGGGGGDGGSTSGGEGGSAAAAAAGEEPWLSLSTVTRGALSVPYVGLRVLPVEVLLDLSSVLRLGALAAPLLALSRGSDASLPATSPSLWVGRKTRCLRASAPLDTISVDQCLASARTARVHYTLVTVHPMRINLTFLQNLSRSKGGGGSGGGASGSDAAISSSSASGGPQAGAGLLKGKLAPMLLNLASVSRAPLRLNCFAVDDAIESSATMNLLVAKHYTRAVVGQLGLVAGSLTALGNPVDLAANVGGGVRDLFYEPAAGAVLGPREFVKGVGRGGRGFVAGVVHGVSSSVAGVATTVNRNLALLTLDEEYASGRTEALAKQAAAAEDMNRAEKVGQGLRNAGSNVLGGFKSGLGGLFSAPVKGAQQEGLKGFVKGVGKGVAGVVLKPVVGITEGVTAVVSSVSDASEMTKAARLEPLRLRRALPVLPATGRMVVAAYDCDGASLQAFALGEVAPSGGGVKGDKEKGKDDEPEVRENDAFVGYCLLEHPQPPRSGLTLRLAAVATVQALVLRTEADPWSLGNEGTLVAAGRAGELAASAAAARRAAFRAMQERFLWGQVVRAEPAGDGSHQLRIRLYRDPGGVASRLGLSLAGVGGGAGGVPAVLVLQCRDEAELSKLYGLVASRRAAMGDPKSMAATLAEARLGQRAAARATSGSGAAEGVARPGSGFSATGATAAAASSSRYTFGAANKPFELELGLAGAEQGLDERALLEMAKGDLADALRGKTGGGSSGGGTGGGAVYSDRAAPLGFVGAEAKKALDSTAWSLVRRWVGTHKMLNSKRLVCGARERVALQRSGGRGASAPL